MVLTVAGALASAAAAQNQYDALRFLGNDVNGTARFVGMGGAMSSLGQICLLLEQTLPASDFTEVMMLR